MQKKQKFLVVDDEFGARKLLLTYLQPLGECDIAVNGKEAAEAVKLALQDKKPYDLICLDIMMPELDGQATLRAIRALEDDAGIDPGDGVKIIMTTCLDDARNVMQAFREQCEAYIIKPIEREKLYEQMRKLHVLD